MMQQDPMKSFDYNPLELFASELSGMNSNFSSPQFTTVHDPLMVDGLSTISPAELFVNPPPSAFSANLTSPYTPPLSLFNHSPDDWDTSPLMDSENTTDNWYSLFPDAANDSEESAKPVSSVQDPAKVDDTPLLLNDDAFLNDSPDTSPRYTSSPLVGQKHSAKHGIRKNRPDRLQQEVPPSSDPVAMKRWRNTMAARKSRAKKVEKMEEMEAKIEELEAQVEYWKSIALDQRSRS
ncbi:General control protein [Rhizina undulata]